MKFEDMGFLFPYVRFFNASPQGGSLDFYVGNTLVAAGIRFGSFTDYIKTGTAPCIYRVTRAGIKNEKVCEISLGIKTGNVCTLCVTGKPNEAEFTVIEEPTQKITMDYGHIRICNFVPGSSDCNVLAKSQMILSRIGFREASKYMEIIPDEYEIAFETKQKKVINCGRYNFSQGKFNTLYILGIENENPQIQAVMTVDAASYNGFYL